MTMLPPASIVYTITESDFEKLILQVEQRGFERGQKKPVEKPLTKEEAANYLRIHVNTLDQRFKNRSLPTSLRHYNGGSIYFFASELENFLKTS